MRRKRMARGFDELDMTIRRADLISCDWNAAEPSLYRTIVMIVSVAVSKSSQRRLTPSQDVSGF
jgi:hypothetical protein